jgi:uncharacterized protein YbjT (DUF2867 family)
MKIVIIGGTGLIGSKVSTLLRQSQHEVVAAAPNTGVNTITGEGLDNALRGADVVIDVANSPSFEDRAVLSFFETSGRNLLDAELRAGVKHHVALSVVGTDLLQESGYFRGKQAQEDIVVRSGQHYTIVRSTQFFEFLKGIVDSSVQEGEIHLAPVGIQPIASDDVAAKIAEIAVGEPINSIVEIAGPNLFILPELVSLYLNRIEDIRAVKVDEQARYFGALLGAKTLVPNEGVHLGKIDFDNWIQTVLVGLPKA